MCGGESVSHTLVECPGVGSGVASESSFDISVKWFATAVGDHERWPRMDTLAAKHLC